MRAAAQAGALVATYADALALLKPDGRIGGATVRDALTGRTLHVRALGVVNATGPWVDALRRLDDPRALPPLRPPQGPHLPGPRTRRRHTTPLTLPPPPDGRHVVLLPRGG